MGKFDFNTIHSYDQSSKDKESYAFFSVDGKGDFLHNDFELVNESGHLRSSLRRKKMCFATVFNDNNNFIRSRNFYSFDHLCIDLASIKTNDLPRLVFETPYTRGGERLFLAVVVVYDKEQDAYGVIIRRLLYLEEYLGDVFKESRHDLTTGLYNKKMCLASIGAMDLRAGGFVGFMDLNVFKLINDIYGHLEGDQILKIFASCLLDALPPNCQVFRYGGDEFVLIAEKTDEETLINFLKEVAVFFAERSPEGMDLSYSAGIVKTGEWMPSPLFLIRCSDKAMYLAKKEKKLFYFMDEAEAKAVVKEETC